MLIGVALSAGLHVVGQANRVTVKRWRFTDEGDIVETDPPAELPANDVVVLQPYGSLFFASAPIVEQAFPTVTTASHHTVVILRLRERSDIGSTFIDVLRRYAAALRAADSKLMIASVNDRLAEQLRVAGLTAALGAENLYPATERLGAAVARAYEDALAWVNAHEHGKGTKDSP